MTTVEFPFGVKKDSEGVASFVDIGFRFTIRTALELERASGGLQMLLARGQSVWALVLLVCYGLKWNRKKITEDDAIQLLDQFVEADGDTRALTQALSKALNESGVYGPDADKTKSKIDLSLPAEPEADPLAPTIQ